MGKVLQVVDDDGNYQQDAVEAFVREQDLDSAGVNYQIVAIMGPQSSGKSTLMNAVVSPFFPPSHPPVGGAHQLQYDWSLISAAHACSAAADVAKRQYWTAAPLCVSPASDVAWGLSAVQHLVRGDGCDGGQEPDHPRHLASTLLQGTQLYILLSSESVFHSHSCRPLCARRTRISKIQGNVSPSQFWHRGKPCQLGQGT